MLEQPDSLNRYQISDTIPTGSGEVTRKQLRGSTALLVGRFLSTAINFANQLLIVRYLSMVDFGALSYIIAMVNFCEPVASLGLRRAITRFVPIYHEKGDGDKLVGTIVLVVGTIIAFSCLVISAVLFFPDAIMRLMNREGANTELLRVLIFLVPIEALDRVFLGLFASFTGARAIFFRKYLLAPGLKTALIALVIMTKGGIVMIAWGTVAAGIITTVIFSMMLVSFMRKRGLLSGFSRQAFKVPAREIIGFSLPALTSDLVAIAMYTANILIIGYFHDATEVARFRVVLPAVKLNHLVMNSFAILFTPSAARLFAKGDHEGINQLYWKTAVWLAVLSFPVFAFTFSVAKPVTVLLYGQRYAGSGTILALMSLGYYFNVMLGFNGLTLKVLGRVKYILWINITATGFNILLNLLLIPQYGAVGAAVATCLSMIFHNILKQAGLLLATGLQVFDGQYAPFYLRITICTIALLLFQAVTDSSIFVTGPVILLLSSWLFIYSNHSLGIAETFPRLSRMPMLRRFLV